MIQIVTLEVGDQATPLVDVTFADPVTGVSYTFPTKNVPATVRSRLQVSIDVDSDTPIYDYQLLFDPAVSTEVVVPADPDDPESEEQTLVFSEQIINFEAEDLGLITGQEPVIDVNAIQQTVNTNKQISQSSLSTATSINNQVQQDTSNIETYGREEILRVVEKMEMNDSDIQGRDVSGLGDEDLIRFAQENKLTAEILGSDQQIMLEYIDNVFAFREVLKSIKQTMYESQEQSQEQTVLGLEEDQENADAFHDLYLGTTEAQDALANPEDFDYPSEQRDDELYPRLSEIATLMQSSLLNPESNATVTITPEEDTTESEPLPDTELIIPPGVNEEDL